MQHKLSVACGKKPCSDMGIFSAHTVVYASQCIFVLVVCSISEPTDGPGRPPGLAVPTQSKATPNVPPGLSRSQHHPAEPAASTGKAAAGNNAPSAAAASNAVTSAADTLMNAGAAGPPRGQDTEKQLRNLRKKIRQADATVKKAAAGQRLTPEEEEKLKNLAAWYVLEYVLQHDNAAACKG